MVVYWIDTFREQSWITSPKKCGECLTNLKANRFILVEKFYYRIACELGCMYIYYFYFHAGLTLKYCAETVVDELVIYINNSIFPWNTKSRIALYLAIKHAPTTCS